MQSLAIANPLIFNGKIECTVLEDRADATSVSVSRTLSLRIEERSLDNNDSEVRIELGNPDDLEFLYAEGISKDKYKELENIWNVDSSFEDCFRVVLAPILKEGRQTVQYACSLSQNGTICLFEIVAKRECFRLKMPIKLYRVSGDSLIKHLAASIRNCQKKIAKLTRSLEDSSSSCSSLQHQVHKWKEECEKLSSTHNEMTKRIEKLEREKVEAENENELHDDYIQDTNDQIAKLIEDNDRLTAEIAELNVYWIADVDKAKCEWNILKDDISLLGQENSSLKNKVDILTEDLSKAKHVISKYCDLKGEAISVDGKKLQEMENAIYEKDEVIQQLRDALDSTTKKMEEKQNDLHILKKDLGSKDDRIVDLEKKLTLYRSTGSPGHIASRMTFPLKETTPKQSSIRPLANITPSVMNNLPPPTNGCSSPKPSFRQARVSTPTFDAFRKDNAQK